MVKIIFSDIDGTLINSDFKVTEKTKSAIGQAINQGMTFVPVSARMPEAIKPIIDTIGIKTPIISYNGALVQTEDDETITSIPMETEIALELCHFIQKNHPQIAWNIYSYHDWYGMDRSNDWIQREEEIVGVLSHEAELSALEDLEAVHKVLLMGNPDLIAPLEISLKELYPDLSIAKSAPYFIEIMAPGIRKGEAVKTFADYLSVAIEDTIAFGDNFNDLDMLQTVGKGFVMSNGPKEVQDAIGNITADHNHDGIALVLSDYL